MMQQPYYNTMYPQPSLYPTKTIDTNNNILWVDGEVGAKAYPLYGEKELQQAEQYQLYKKAMNYDMPTIVQEQQR